jgi:hypothetical protein
MEDTELPSTSQRQPQQSSTHERPLVPVASLHARVVAAAAASAISAVVVTPLDVVKTRMQASSIHAPHSSL